MKLISTLILVVAFSFAAFGQDYMTSLTYNVAAPAGETNEFIDQASYLGIGFDGRKFILPFMTVGFYAGWQVFYQQTTEPLQLDNGTVSGKQFRYINSFPIMLNSHIWLGGEECFRPYVGLNVGAYYNWSRLTLGVRMIEEKNWQLGFAPEAGFTLPVGDVHINLGAKFH